MIGQTTSILLFFLVIASTTSLQGQQKKISTKPKNAEMLIDGTRKMLDDKWTYWEGPRFAGSLPIKWQIVADPVSSGDSVLNSNDPTAPRGKFGMADIVTKKEYRDFRLHVEFFITAPKGNSGVYLQNRYEIQIYDGDTTIHGMGAVINEAKPSSNAYLGIGKWNTYDIVFRAARFSNGVRTERARVTLYFNGIKVHDNQEIEKVWGGKNSGQDGGTDVTDRPGGIKLQAEGHDVFFRNIWIQELVLKKPKIRF